MKILQVCKKFPYPLKDGETIAIHNLSKSFRHWGCTVKILAINTPKHHFEPEALPEAIRDLGEHRAVFVDTSLRVKDAFLNLFTRESYNIQRFDSQDFRAELCRCLQAEEFDIIQLEGLYLAPYLADIRRYSKAQVVMRAHNVEAEIWQRLARGERNPLKRAYLGLLSKRMRRYELSMLNEYDALVPISEKDARYFRQKGCKLPMFTLPTGVDGDKLRPNRAQIEWPSVFHIGALDWLPNQEGILWFLQEVWPLVRAQYPDLKFYLAGRHTPEAFFRLQVPGLEVLGEVEDAVAFMNSKALMIVPLQSGSGMRIKIMEALALGKTIVTTAVGLEGIEAKDGEQVLVADQAKDFAQALLRCLDNREFSEKIGENAHIFAAKRYDNHQLTAGLLDFYQALARKQSNLATV